MNEKLNIKAEPKEEINNQSNNDKSQPQQQLQLDDINNPNSIAFVKYGRRTLEKGTQAYFEMRERNNKAIHKHRQKKRDEMKLKTITNDNNNKKKNFINSISNDSSTKNNYNNKNGIIETRRGSSVDDIEFNDENSQFIKHECPKLRQYFESHILDMDIVVKKKIRKIFDSLEYKLSKFY